MGRGATALGGVVAVLVAALLAAGVTFSAISARHVAIEETIAECCLAFFRALLASLAISVEPSGAPRTASGRSVR